MGKKATAVALLEPPARDMTRPRGYHFAREALGFPRMRGGDLVEAAIPSPAALQKLAFIYAAREAAWPHSLWPQWLR